MKKTVLFLAVFTALSTSAFANGLAKEFKGYWVPTQGMCNSALGVQVSDSKIIFKNGNLIKSYESDEPCYSCAGGANYAGIIVQLMPKNSNDDFMIYFNAEERKGVAIVDIYSPDLLRQFPLKSVKLKKCSK